MDLNVPSSPDPLGELDPSTHCPTQSSYAFTANAATATSHKRTASSRSAIPDALRPAPFQFTAASRPLAQAPVASTCEEALSIARSMVIQASALATSRKTQTDLLDLLEVFRDYTENNRVNKHSVSVLASQVSNLESVSRAIGSKTKLLQKPALAAVTQALPQRSTPAASTPAATSASASASTSASTTTAPSYATAAANGQPKTDWQTVAKKKTPIPTPKNSLSTRQLVLLQDQQTSINSTTNSFSSLAIRGARQLPVEARNAARNLLHLSQTTYDIQAIIDGRQQAFEEARARCEKRAAVIDTSFRGGMVTDFDNIERDWYEKQDTAAAAAEPVLNALDMVRLENAALIDNVRSDFKAEIRALRLEVRALTQTIRDVLVPAAKVVGETAPAIAEPSAPVC
ncbi:hypothetical protein EJ07DRAFT_180621 [Lizonia empirigonia]|nr:hypothetical protein EJ07DRAFT_180621 [Lizonia empirigonia]